MQLKIYPDYPSLCRAAADLIGDYIRHKKDALVCLASGHTPIGVFNCLVEDVDDKKLDLSTCTFVSLDEWIGIPPDQEGSCRQMMDKDFFNPLKITPGQIRFFDGLTKNPQQDCQEMNAFISARGGLDIMLVGVGTNGHIAMNEPGTSFDTYAHISQLSEETKTVGQKYFSSQTELSTGLTLGLRHLKEARLPIVMANGTRKASIMKRALTEKPTEQIPVTLAQLIPQGFVLLDNEAAAQLPAAG